MNRQTLGNILLVTLIILSGSGILMYLTPFKKNIASLHTVFALLFILAMVFHIFNNKKPLANYISGEKQSFIKKFQAPIIFSIIILIGVGLFFDLPGFKSVYTWGNQFRNGQLGKIEETLDYQIIDLENKSGHRKINVELKKGEAFQYPLFAIWAEDSLGNYLETLYISRVISSSTFDFGKKIGDNWESAVLRRPEALPYWSHKRGIKAQDGLYIPLNGSQDLDAVSGATPTGNFIIKSKSKIDNIDNYKVMVELNQSYDWNEYFTEDKFPDDKIYSGSGKIGQPSLIYSAEVSSKDNAQSKHKIMELIGHGHYSGKDGKLYSDLTNITTAKNIADRIILTID